MLNFKENDIVTIKEGSPPQFWLKAQGQGVENETFFIKKINKLHTYPYTIASTARDFALDLIGEHELQLATFVEQSTLEDYTWE